MAEQSDALNARQEMFVREYLIDLNATAAYRRAGYKSRGNAAEVAASRLLRNVQVKDAIESALAERHKRLQMSADEVITELSCVGRSDIGQILDFTRIDPHLRPANQIPETARRAIASVKVRRYMEGHGDDAREVEVTEFKLWDKLSALDKLGKHHKLFREIHEHTGKDGAELILKVIGGSASMEDL